MDPRSRARGLEQFCLESRPSSEAAESCLPIHRRHPGPNPGLLLLLFLAACGGKFIGTKPRPTDPAAATTVILAREGDIRVHLAHTIEYDGQPIATVGDGEYIRFEVDPGIHYIALIYSGTLASVIRFNAAPRDTVVIFCNNDMVTDCRRVALADIDLEDFDRIE